MDSNWSKIEKYIESSSISPNGKRIAVEVEEGDILLFLLKKEMQEAISNSQGVAESGSSPDARWFLMRAENNLVISDQFGRTKKKIAIENQLST
jgi:hypothetical protein